MKFSIVIPCHKTFDRESNFIKTLATIDGEFVQIVVVFDNLDGNSENRLVQILDKYPKLKFDIVKGKFGSPGAARNAGLEKTLHEWIVFWDFDDLPNFRDFKNAIELAILNNYDCVVGGYKEIRLDKNCTEVDHKFKSNYLDQISLNPGIWRFAFSKKLITGEQFPSISMAEDQVFIGRVLMKSPLILVCNEIFYSYFIGDENQVTRQRNLFSDLLISSSLLIKEIANPRNTNKTFVSRLVLRQLTTATLRGTWSVKIRSILQFLVNPTILRLAIKKQNGSGNILHLTGGLGNQLFQYAAALALTGGKGFSIETKLGKPRVNSAGEAEILSFGLVNTWKTSTNLDSKSLLSKVTGFKLRMGITSTQLEKIVAMKRTMDFLINTLMSCAYRKRLKTVSATGVGYCDIQFGSDHVTYLIGYFQSWRWAHEPRVLNQLKLLKPLDWDANLDYWQRLAKVENPLIVHFRLGDYKKEDNFGIPSLTYYKEAIEQAWISGKYEKIWIFSDEIDLAKERFKIKVLNDARWINTSKDSSANALEIMRLGAGYVIANSSFSWWAAFLSHSENPEVIAPSPWFKNLEEPLDLIPKNWTRKAAWNK
jgi:glycosyltransferase involved in cell wall biosynthesis